MKLTALFVFIGCLHLSATSYSQTITLNTTGATLKDVFNTIQQQTNYKVVYNVKFLQHAKPVSISAKEMPLAAFLDAVLDEQALTYDIREMTILIGRERRAGTPPPAEPSAAPAQQRVITGTVTDETGQPLEGVTVTAKASAVQVTTNAAGQFRIQLANNDQVLVFSMMGYESREQAIGNSDQLSVRLDVSVSDLSEVVVVGYGTQKRQDVTGSISSIAESDIRNVVITSADQALQGRAAGVQMTQTSSAPGGNVSVRIRGGNSLSAGNEPLYVIDGFPIYNDNGQYTAGALNNGQPANVLASLNPSDIESMEILKDASATAIYGARGANGVVIITTKRGKAGQSNINFESYYGTQRVGREIPLLNATEFARLANMQEAMLGNPEPYPNPESYGVGTNWQREGFQVAPIQNYQLGFNGGDAKTQYAISGNYFGQEGIVRGSNLQRGSVRINLDRSITDKLKLGASVNGSRTLNNQITSDTDPAGAGSIGAITSLITTTPVEPVYDDAGSYNRFFAENGNFIVNPIARLLETVNLAKTSRILGNVNADYKILDGLVARVSLGIDQINVKEDYFLPAAIQDEGVDAVARLGFIQSFSWLNENTLTYQRTFDERHAFTGLVGFTRQAFTRESARTGSQRFVNDILEHNSLNSGALTIPPQSSRREWALESYIGRVNYGYDDRFLVTLTGRIDGSSRFGADNKYSFFPSGSVAWRLSEERFIQSLTFVDELKVRLSYGRTGNQEIPQYRSLAALSNSNAPIGGAIVSGLTPSRVANPNLRWESTEQYDVGLDVGLFSNRIKLTADYYNKRTIDLLLDVAIPNSSGFETALQNIGSIENRGLELALNTVNVDRAFKWESAFNITFNRNKVLDLGGEYERPAGQASPGRQLPFSGILRVGEPVGTFYGYLTDGLFRTQAEIDASSQPNVQLGDRRYKDINGDGVLDADDRTILGYAQPDFFYGFTNTFSYKDFDLSVFFQGVQGSSILNLNLNAELNNNVPEAVNRWTPTNTDTDIPRSALGSRITNKQVEDGSFLRLRNVNLGYNLSPRLAAAARLRSIRVYVSAQNWLTFTNYSGFDPEVSAFGHDNLSIGVDRGSYPVAKTFIFGLNIGI